MLTRTCSPSPLFMLSLNNFMSSRCKAFILCIGQANKQTNAKALYVRHRGTDRPGSCRFLSLSYFVPRLQRQVSTTCTCTLINTENEPCLLVSRFPKHHVVFVRFFSPAAQTSSVPGSTHQNFHISLGGEVSHDPFLGLYPSHATSVLYKKVYTPPKNR